jgi:CheY-like chemotaxis protein
VSAPHLLVVEDDTGVGEALADVLRDAGYSVTWALDGNHAMRTLRGGLRPAAILLDLMMPGMDGYTFRAEQQADPALAGIPVILLTAMRGADRAAATLAAAACVPKPARVDDLLAAVSRVAGPVVS